MPPGTPPIRAERRDIGRTGRLFWLTGRRSELENWDAFEAPDGEPLLLHNGSEAEWPALKLWLNDLAHELAASADDGSTPPLALDRIWIRNDGRLVLLDFPAPGTLATSTQELSEVKLLSAVASMADVGASNAAGPPAIPLSARTMLEGWAGVQPPSFKNARRTLIEVTKVHDHVQRWRRALPIAFIAAPCLLVLATLLLILPSLYGFLQQNSAMMGLIEALHQPNPPAGSRLRNPEVRDAFETYLVGTYGEQLKSEAFWSSPLMQRLSDRRAVARRAIEHHPSVSPEELARVKAMIASDLQRAEGRMKTSLTAIAGSVFIMLGAVTAMALILAMSCSLISSVVFPGGVVMRFLGLAVVTRNGIEITRLRSLLRALLAWMPAILWLAFLLASPKIQGWVPAPRSNVPSVILLGILALGAIWSITRTRGLQDRIAGTWIVPR